MTAFARLAIAAAGLFGAIAPAAAGSHGSQFGVSVTAQNNCTVNTADITFGNYAAGSATPVTANTTVVVICPTGVPYSLALNGGSTTGAMGARATSDGTAATSLVKGTGNDVAQPLAIYGRIPAAQFVDAGRYSDRVTVTVTY